jgi:hypothetical protein
MKVLLLSPYSGKIIQALNESDDTYEVELGPISCEFCARRGFDFIVSYGYRHIIHQEVLELFGHRAVNLHISMLPSCRGSHPNFWSIVEGVPSGVTIHLLDKGLDTGNILIQQEVQMDLRCETFASTYGQLSSSIERLFYLNWKYLRTGECGGWSQNGPVSSHRSCELEDWLEYLPQSWDTPILLFQKLAAPRLSRLARASSLGSKH